MNNDIVIKKLDKLKMLRMAETFEHRLDAAMKEKWSYSQLIEMLLTDEIERRGNSQLTKRLAKSRLDQNMTLETFDFSFNVKIQESLIRELASCAFMEKKQNIFFLGGAGCGKTHLAQALGHQACRRELDVLFYCTYQLFEWIHAGQVDGTHDRRLAQVCKIPLLILDGFGLQTLNEAQQSDLYQLISERYGKSSTIITSNRDFDEWPSIFANRLLGSAALDRLVHRGVEIVIEGESYRLAEFKKACRKDKKAQ
jgi:DNA replication protein DnaC